MGCRSLQTSKDCSLINVQMKVLTENWIDCKDWMSFMAFLPIKKVSWFIFLSWLCGNLIKTNLLDSIITWTQGIFLKWKEFLICQFPGGNFCMYTKQEQCLAEISCVHRYKAALNICKLGWFWQRQSPNKCSFLWKYRLHCAYHALILQLITLVRFEPW